MYGCVRARRGHSWLMRQLKLYLTDFLNRSFAGENAVFHDFRGGEILTPGAVYHAGINHRAALRNSAAHTSGASRGLPLTQRSPARGEGQAAAFWPAWK